MPPEWGGKYLALLGGTFSLTGKISANKASWSSRLPKVHALLEAAAARSDPAPASRRRDLRIEQALLR
jgi:hypothetical protein